MKIKKPYRSKSIKERSCKPIGGEESPYWSFMKELHQNDDYELTDDPLANPDVFAEDDSVFSRPVSPLGELQLEAFHDVLPSLSPQQQRVIELCGFDGLTLEATAAKMGISISTVRVLLDRARVKIKRRADQLLDGGDK